MGEGLKLSIGLHTTDYRGDHSADVVIFHDLNAGPGGDHAETVEQLVRRLLLGNWTGARGFDWIEIRVVQPVRRWDAPKETT